MRRGLGRGRTLIALGAILAIAGTPLAWIKVGGIVLSPRTASGFDGSGVLVFLASVLMLAVIVLPYTNRKRRSTLDRPVLYLALLLVALAGLLPAVIALLDNGSALGPTDVPGIWLAAAGTALEAWGVAELFAERGPG